MSADAPFKGRGFAFPPAFTRGGAAVAMVAGDEDIAQSLEIILATRPGERVMQSGFGCNLDEAVFDRMDQDTVGRIARLVADAIRDHEPRVDLLGVEVGEGDSTAGRLDIAIAYRSRLTNARWNLVYPFSIREAVPDPGAPGD